mmetsp:Transcript_1917/g.2136  ORF Transcript_1917/g.2136 Transcript_1917/m.2136 type:complete len:299 (-) Transcript_1917:146-1042(-)|eukprot:CAMPEP_0197850772 /NCGR_PEP_ID=MMETSP1438-20131217/16339_1 /TAXON_ID=1461541 /ORGANISM="Pterosperma sp., Strain CCMP1384" /LENGTH=298 /DNA_ID=CAMNT_0043464115 /DNA_START=76 /DNA_END=972 /DNA_ORIENTATION=+
MSSAMKTCSAMRVQTATPSAATKVRSINGTPLLSVGRKVAAPRRLSLDSRRRAVQVSASITVFGGSGGTGSEVIYQALAQGESVVTLARDPAKVVIPPGSGGDDAGKPFNNDKLTILKGDVTNPADVAKVVTADTTGVVISLGGKTKDVGPTMLTDGTSNVIAAMNEQGVKRVACVTSIGAGDSKDQAPFFFKVLMFTVMKSIFNDKNNQEALFMNGPGKDLDYTIVRPGGLGTGPATGEINVIDGEAGNIERADVATFCLGAIQDESFPYLKQTPCISSVEGTSWVKDRGDKSMFEA